MNTSFIPLPRSTPVAESVSALQLDAMERALAGSADVLRGYVLLRNGRVVRETMWQPYRADAPMYVYSLTKMFTSTAVGLAVDEGLLSVDDVVVGFFPDKQLPAERRLLEQLRVRDLLTMTTGHDIDTLPKIIEQPDGDWVQLFLSQPIVHQPGSHFLYNSGGSHMLSAIVQRVTGRTMEAYLREKLLLPLGFGDYSWLTNACGETSGGWGLAARMEDIAKLGQLYFDGGVYNGQRILSEAWVAEASRKQVDNDKTGNTTADWTQGYGYHLWRCRHNAYRGDGAFGQYCVMLPEQQAVLVLFTESVDMQATFDRVWAHLLPALTTAASPQEAQYNGTYTLADNALGVHTIDFDLAREAITVTLHGDGVSSALTAGRGAWHDNAVDWPLGSIAFLKPKALGGVQARPACCHWLDGQTLDIEWRYQASVHQNHLVCRFDGDTVTLRCPANCTEGAPSVVLTGVKR